MPPTPPPAPGGFPRAPGGPPNSSRHPARHPARTEAGTRLPLSGLLAGIAVVEGLDAAAQLVAARPDLTAVTRAGDVLTALTLSGGSAKAPSLIEVQAAVDDASARLAAVTAGLERQRFALAAAQARRTAAQDRADAALEKLHDSDARLAAVAERLGHLNSVLRSAVGESERLAASLASAEANIVTEQEALEAVAARLAAAQEAPAEEEPSPEHRDALALAASLARSAEMEVRLGLRSAEEQLSATRNRASSLERAAATERRAREEAAERARRRRLQAKRAAAVSAAVAQVTGFLDVSVDLARQERDSAEERKEQMDAELAAVRSGNDALARELAELTDSVHRDELARAQQRLRIEALELRSVEELGLTADQLVADFGPDQPVPVPAAESADKWAALRAPVDEDGREIVAGKPFVREEQEKRLETGRTGPVGPGPGQPPGAGGIRRPRGAPPVPQHPARRPQIQPQGPAGHHQGSRRAGPEGLRRGVRGHLGAVRPDLRAAVPRRRGPPGPHRPLGHAHHRHRG